jgi:hypothetical protein
MTKFWKRSEDGVQTASLGFNTTLPDAPHGSNLFAHLVRYQERRIKFLASPAGPASMDSTRRQGEWKRAADAGRSLQ